MKKLILVFVAALVVFSCRKQASDNLRPEIETKSSSQEVKFFEKKKNLPVADGVLFKFKESANRAAFKSIPFKYYKYFGKIDVKNADSLVTVLKQNPLIEYAEPNYTQSTQDFNDPYFSNGNLWGMNAIGAPTAWNSGNVGSKQVYVGVIDQGCMYYHCDLTNQNWGNPFEVAGNNKDDDGNGYVDDLYGYNFYDDNNQIYVGSDFHGTHVSGTIGGKGNNGIGVLGVSPNVKLINCKFLGESSGSTDAAIRAIDYLIDLKKRHNLNLVAISNSWGGGGFSQSLLDAILRAKAANILFICAAGNSNQDNDATPFYPASYNADNIISVGAMASDFSRATFSCYGQTTVDLFAPGVGITSTLPGSDHITSIYGAYSGTSMATPHVSGAAALYAAVHPNATYTEIKNALLSTVTKTTTFSTLCASGGYLNVSSFTGSTPAIVPDATCGTPPAIDNTPPSTGVLLSAIPQNIDYGAGTVDIYCKWKPITDVGSGVTEIWFRVFNNGSFDYWWALGFNGTEFNFTGLPLGLSHGVFDIYFQSKDGWSNWSDTSNHIIVDLSDTTGGDRLPPTLIDGVVFTALSSSSVRLTYPGATDNVGVDHFNCYIKKSYENTYYKFSTTDLQYTWNNLLPSTTYNAYVEAVDAAGNVSVPSDVLNATTPAGTGGDVTPPAVTITNPQDGYQIPTKGNKNVKISFTATDNVGVTGRQILIDGVVVAINVSSYTWNANKASAGNHIITCNAFDAAGNLGTKSVTVIKN